MYRNLLIRWTRFVIAYPRLVLLALAICTIGAGYIALTQFSIDSNTSKLIRQDAQWRRNQDAFLATFTQYARNTFVVVSGASISAVNNVSRELEQRLRLDDTFESIYAPANSDFVEEHAFLYMDVDHLDRVISNLAAAQPVLGSIAKDPNLRGLLGVLVDGLNNEGALPEDFKSIVDLLEDSAGQALNGSSDPAAWRDLLLQKDTEKIFYNIIVVKGRDNFGESLPNAEIVESLETAIASLEHPSRHKVRVRLTGQIPLDHREIASAIDSAQLAGSIALVVLVVVLTVGVKSFIIVAATYLSMIVGLIWTAAYASLAVGEYSTISIIFLVMFIGLGVDFAIHLCLRYQEALGTNLQLDALLESNTEMGPAISLCALSSALGFLAFVPTDYRGLADLGIISAGGMAIALFISLTLIPAFFAVVEPPRKIARKRTASRLLTSLLHQRRFVIFATLGLAVVALTIARDAYFDYSTLALKDPNSEEMQTFRELQREKVITDYAIVYVAPDRASAEEAKLNLSGLDTIAEVKIFSDYLPDQQQEKLSILEDAMMMLASTFMPSQNPQSYSAQERSETIENFSRTVKQHPVQNPEIAGPLQRLVTHLKDMSSRSNAREIEADWEASVIGPALRELQWLERALAVDAFDFDELPADLRARLVTQDGKVLVSITPAEDIVSVEALERFAIEVTDAVPGATGRPIVELGISKIVLTSFAQAIALSVSGIFIILMFALRNPVDVVLVFVPLTLATIMTFATSVLTDLPLNMANVVVVPLIFGLGVDNGIHVVNRFHQTANLDDFVSSSTPTAVLLSTLTTVGTFGALSFSSHHGIFSIGVLLTCALSYLLVLTLIVLPVLLNTFSTPKARQTFTG